MFRLLILLLLTLSFASPAAAERIVTDSAGRQVAVPDRIERVFAAGPPASVMLYALAPETMVGWVRAPTPAEKEFIAEPYRELPETGRLTGRGDTANLEVVLRSKPDLILDVGTVSDTYVSLADRVQAQTGIPYLLVDGRFANTAGSLRLVGEVLGRAEAAAKLATYAERTFADLDAVLAAVPEAARPRVYLARSADGLETGLVGSINTEIIERAGGRNVVTGGGDRQGLARVGIEQVIAANPDTIITWDKSFFDNVGRDPLWQQIDAVRRGRVHLSPLLPFGWIDRPPALNRLIGLTWLASLFYPDRTNTDLRAATRAFYDLFFHVQLTNEQLDRLLASSGG